MSLNCVAASSQRIHNAVSPILAYPFTIGFWARPATLAFSYPFSNVDMGTNNTAFVLMLTDAPSGWYAGAMVETAQELSTGGAGAPEVDKWSFVIGRWISATNRRTATVNPNGSAGHDQRTASLTPTGIDRMVLGTRDRSAGSTSPFDGLIAEFWCTNTDIQPDGAQLDDGLLRQLAYGGPFSVPYIAKDIVEYRSLRNFPSSEADALGEVYHGAAGRQTWVPINSPTTGPHPPLPYWYAKPGQNRKFTVPSATAAETATGNFFLM